MRKLAVVLSVILVLLTLLILSLNRGKPKHVAVVWDRSGEIKTYYQEDEKYWVFPFINNQMIFNIYPEHIEVECPLKLKDANGETIETLFKVTFLWFFYPDKFLANLKTFGSDNLYAGVRNRIDIDVKEVFAEQLNGRNIEDLNDEKLINKVAYQKDLPSKIYEDKMLEGIRVLHTTTKSKPIIRERYPDKGNSLIWKIGPHPPASITGNK